MKLHFSDIYFHKSKLLYFIIALIYVIVFILFKDKGFFWDAKLVSIEAHKIYYSGLKILFTSELFKISVTGYHFPFIPILTAILWKIFGYHLWVLHFFMLICTIVLLISLHNLLKKFFTEDIIPLIALLILVEPTVLTQFAIASPDFILLSLFVVTLNGIIDDKKWFVMIGMIAMCLTSMRGIFTGVILSVVFLIFKLISTQDKITINRLIAYLSPFIPAFIILAIYYIAYFIHQGWFLGEQSPYTDHYSMPESVNNVAVNVLSLFVRSIENGRIFIFTVAFFLAIKLVKSKKVILQRNDIFITSLILSLWSLYFIFCFITHMPFSGRYFMPQYLLLTIICCSVLIRIYTLKKYLKVFFVAALLFQITGHFWIYPDNISKAWDTTLAHYPYYELREKCFQYIEDKNINYNDVSGGFSFYGDRKYTELKNAGKIVGNKTNTKFFLYSNISNIEDNFYQNLKNESKWKSVNKWEKGFVKILLYKKISSE